MTATTRPQTLNAPAACLLVFCLWAGLYLPGLGSLPLRHEEPRRALPAVHMLTTHDWLVPRVGATPYLRKPPLLNWLIALSFRCTGGPNEFAARLPSVLAMLALALVVVIAGSPWLGPAGGLLAAIFLLTNLAAMETGRLAELEALYLALTGIALMLWLTGWRNRASPWYLWGAPAPFLALGMLTKGPAHLLFFYGIAGAVLMTAREWKLFWHPAHGVALLVVVVPVLAWAIPCAVAVAPVTTPLDAGGAWAVWWREISSRMTSSATGHFSVAEWFWRVPQGFINFLPWTALLPLLWSPRVLERLAGQEPRELLLFRGVRWGMVATFLLMSWLPGGSARYVYPLLVIPSVLLARALTVGIFDPNLDQPEARLLPAWRATNRILCGLIVCTAALMPCFVVAGASLVKAILEACVIVSLALILMRWRFGSATSALPPAIQSAAGMVMITFIYALAAVPRLDQPRAGQPRDVAALIRQHVPSGQVLGVLDDGYRPFWYYLEPAVVYFKIDDRLPRTVGYFLLPGEMKEKFAEETARQGITLSPVFETTDAEHHSFILSARRKSLAVLPTPSP